MPANLSIKSVSDQILKRLRQQAARHHRSLQGELLAIIERSVLSDERLTVDDVLDRVRRSGLRTPSDATRMIRRDRDAR